MCVIVLYLIYFFFFVYFCCVCSLLFVLFFFFKQKTAYEMRISDWSSDVCSSDLMWIDFGLAADVRRYTEVACGRDIAIFGEDGECDFAVSDAEGALVGLAFLGVGAVVGPEQFPSWYDRQFHFPTPRIPVHLMQDRKAIVPGKRFARRMLAVGVDVKEMYRRCVCREGAAVETRGDRKSTRLNSSH